MSSIHINGVETGYDHHPNSQPINQIQKATTAYANEAFHQYITTYSGSITIELTLNLTSFNHFPISKYLFGANPYKISQKNLLLANLR
ncbi:hypothetical protein SAMN05443144_13233 [Fodinibius roseus]|uniref:Uncharacterized protein n=1 Tax=Fodinibius roseus TaxID=1194090 RepID=A0A1M5KJI0_9BACT|nr:hypothetical protein SAMN05443144_13233 [Fodinibius roseus]